MRGRTVGQAADSAHQLTLKPGANEPVRVEQVTGDVSALPANQLPKLTAKVLKAAVATHGAAPTMGI